MTRRGRAHGFTLIETLVVLVVLALALSVVAGFAPRHHASLDLADAAQRLADSLRLARAQAIAAQRPVTFAAAGDSQGYLLDGVARPLPRSVAITMTGPAVIRFAPDGSASGGVVRLAADGQARFVQVDWLTGQARITDAR